jgi:hypothetical protein
MSSLREVVNILEERGRKTSRSKLATIENEKDRTGAKRTSGSSSALQRASPGRARGCLSGKIDLNISRTLNHAGKGREQEGLTSNHSHRVADFEDPLENKVRHETMQSLEI